MNGRVATCWLTSSGEALAKRLPCESHGGDLLATVRRLWPEVDGLVLVCATGIAVRAIAPLLAAGSSKKATPAVVSVDDTGRWAICLSGGHSRGGNQLSRDVAALIGAEAVITTATDGAGMAGLDTLSGFQADGDIAAVTRAWLDGRPPQVVVDDALGDWPLPPALRELAGDRPVSAGPVSDGPVNDRRVTVTDSAHHPAKGEVVLRPASLVIGVGSSASADVARLEALALAALEKAALHPGAIGAVATIDLKAEEPAVLALAASLGVAIQTFPASVLGRIEVPHPSAVVAGAVGTPSVAEAAALAASGPGGALAVDKVTSADSTVAIARRKAPAGRLAVVGLGPGSAAHRTAGAAAAVRHATVVIGYAPYLDLASDLLEPHQEVLRYPIGAEVQRCEEALRRAAAGEAVALVCSGDAGVYAMASLVLELAPLAGNPQVTVVAGVTAASAAAAVLGAPLAHDHAAISLSDLLTPWSVIAARVEAAGRGDFVVSLYNPRSARRTRQLAEALRILRQHRSADTPAAIVTSAGRAGQKVVRTTLGTLDPEQVGMLSLVVVGCSATRWIGASMVTPRGYQL
ncbi:MAG: precorrin-3B C(17)-methyltransferase [Acidimicrobiales bacterium]